MQRKIIAGVIIAAVLITGIIIFSGSKKTQPVAARPPQQVGVMTLKEETIHLERELSGRVKASMQSDVRPQVDGIIQAMLFKEGDFVKAGQILYKIAPETYKASYNQASAALKSAEANIQAAKMKAERYTELLEHNGVSRQEYDDASAAYQQALAGVEERRAAVETAKINLDRSEIKAPISGYIGISNFTQGALVTANQQTPLAVIRTLDPVYVDMTQSSVQLAKMRLIAENNKSIIQEKTIGVKLKFEDGNFYKHSGLLALQEVAIDESVGSVTLRAEFPNPDGHLMPGMYVKAVVNGAYVNDGILVKQQAVTFNAKGDASAMVVNADNKVEVRNIKTGMARDDKWPVIEGLHQGERVIVEGIGKVRAGDTVVATEAQ